MPLISLLLAVAVDIQDARSRSVVLGTGAAAVGLVVAPFGAVRLRRQDGGRRGVLAREIACAAALVLTLIALSWPLTIAGTAWLTPSTSPAGVDPVTTGAVYGLWRIVLVAWPTWNRLSRTRLLWSLTHAQLTASLALAAVLSIVLTVVMVARSTGPAVQPGG